MLHWALERSASWWYLVSKTCFICFLLCLLSLLKTSRKLLGNTRLGTVSGRPKHSSRRWCGLLYVLYCGLRRNSRTEWRTKKRRIRLWIQCYSNSWGGLCPGRWSWCCRTRMCLGRLRRSWRPFVFARYVLVVIEPIQYFAHHHHLLR